MRTPGEINSQLDTTASSQPWRAVHIEHCFWSSNV